MAPDLDDICDMVTMPSSVVWWEHGVALVRLPAERCGCHKWQEHVK
jgi:hypothetical protein